MILPEVNLQISPIPFTEMTLFVQYTTQFFSLQNKFHPMKLLRAMLLVKVKKWTFQKVVYGLVNYKVYEWQRSNIA